MPVTSIKDIAREAGVSVATVSRVFNRGNNVNATTREKVLVVAKKHNYRPDSAARNLRRGKQSTALHYSIGLLYPHTTNLAEDPFMAELISGIQHSINENGFGLRMISMSEHEQAATALLKEVDGIITRDFKTLQQFSDELPCVLLDNYQSSIKGLALLPDYERGVYDATLRLLKSGHRRIALPYVTKVENDFGFSSQIYRGWKKAHDELKLEGHNILAGKELHTSRDAYLAVQSLISSHRLPDAIITSDGAMPAIYHALWEAGIRIPEGISLIGIDGISQGAYMNPPLSTIDVHIESIGRKAADALIQMIRSGEQRRGLELIDVNLIIRGSART